jgi:hypothetical protein
MKFFDIVNTDSVLPSDARHPAPPLVRFVAANKQRPVDDNGEHKHLEHYRKLIGDFARSICDHTNLRATSRNFKHFGMALEA